MSVGELFQTGEANSAIALAHQSTGPRFLHAEGAAALLFTENETNNERLFHSSNRTPFVKDGINQYIVHGRQDAVNPKKTGTKASAHYPLTIGAGTSQVVRLRLNAEAPGTKGSKKVHSERTSTPWWTPAAGKRTSSLPR